MSNLKNQAGISLHRDLTGDDVLILLEGDISDASLDISEDEDENRLIADWNTEPSNELESLPGVAGPSQGYRHLEVRRGDRARRRATVGSAEIVNAALASSGNQDDPDSSIHSSSEDEPADVNKRSRPKRVSRPTANLRWRHKDIEPVDSSFKGKGFSAPPMEEKSPYEYFKLFCNDELFELFANETNLYSVQKDGISVNTNKVEMEQFVGIHVITGIVHMPSYRDFWRKETRYPPVADIMSRNRFDKLRTYMHVNDNTKMLQRNSPGYDKLFKIRPMVDILRRNFQSIEPEEYQSVDELMIPYKGRNTLKQYIKSKPHRWGIKVFAIAGSSGILYDFSIYVGKDTVTEKVEGLGVSGSVVMQLLDYLPQHQNFKICMDNWFSSHQLMVTLKDKGFLAVGTVRSNRLPNCSFETEKELKKRGRGSYDFKTEVNNNVLAVKWFDNKCVHIVSTYVGVEPIANVQRWSVQANSHVDVPRPACIATYNKYMGGVDLHDMLVELYRTNVKGRRYYLRIIFHLIDSCIVNGWLLYRRHEEQRGNKRWIPLKNFRSQVAEALLRAGKVSHRKRGRPSDDNDTKTSTLCKRSAIVRPVSDVQYDQLGHWPVHVMDKQRCKLCIKSYSRVQCEKCNLALCLTKDRNCFRSFHNK